MPVFYGARAPARAYTEAHAHTHIRARTRVHISVYVYTWSSHAARSSFPGSPPHRWKRAPTLSGVPSLRRRLPSARVLPETLILPPLPLPDPYKLKTTWSLKVSLNLPLSPGVAGTRRIVGDLSVLLFFFRGRLEEATIMSPR